MSLGMELLIGVGVTVAVGVALAVVFCAVVYATDRLLRHLDGPDDSPTHP